VDVRCAATTGGGWADLVADAEPGLSGLAGGTRLAVEVVAPAGGFSNYPVLSMIDAQGPAPEHASDAGASPPPGDDFSQLRPRATRAGRTLRCAIDFLGRLRAIDARDRRLRPYPDEALARIDVKCRGPSGDGWIDLVAAPADREAVLGVRRGRTVGVRVLSLDGGHAGRPIAGLPP